MTQTTSGTNEESEEADDESKSTKINIDEIFDEKRESDKESNSNESEKTKSKSESGGKDWVPEERSEEKRTTKSSTSSEKGSSDHEDLEKKSEKKQRNQESKFATFQRVVSYTLTNFFSWNPKYFIQFRGILNILQLILNLTILCLMGASCQLRISPQQGSEGFYCKSVDMFLFVIANSSFMTAIILVPCCIMSKSTDMLLYETAFEVSYYVVYFVFYMTAGVSVMISIASWGPERENYGNDYAKTNVSSILAVLNGAFYGVNALWYFISHQYRDRYIEVTEAIPEKKTESNK